MAKTPPPRRHARSPCLPGTLAVRITEHTQSLDAASPVAGADPANEKAKAELHARCSHLDTIIAALAPVAVHDADAARLMQLRAAERETLINQIKGLKPLAVQVQHAAVSIGQAAKAVQAHKL